MYAPATYVGMPFSDSPDSGHVPETHARTASLCKVCKVHSICLFFFSLPLPGQFLRIHKYTFLNSCYCSVECGHTCLYQS